MRSRRPRPKSCAWPTARAAKVSSRSSAEARKRFWLDRSRTAAIAKHTNAFKINEDVVIPLDRMGEYTDGIERINIELSIKNKLQLVDALRSVLQGQASCRSARATTPMKSPSAELLEDRRSRRWICSSACARAGVFARQARPAVARGAALSGAARATKPLRRQLRPTRRRTSRCDRVPCHAGPNDPRVVEAGNPRELRRFSTAASSSRSSTKRRRSTSSVLRGRVFVALHMHAGDGNVHTNLPVNSDNYEMLQDGPPRRSRAS